MNLYIYKLFYVLQLCIIFVNSAKIQNLSLPTKKSNDYTAKNRNVFRTTLPNKSSKTISKKKNLKKSLNVNSYFDYDSLLQLTSSTSIYLDSFDNKIKDMLSSSLNIKESNNMYINNIKELINHYTFLIEKNTYNILSNIPWSSLYSLRQCINNNCTLEKNLYSYELCLNQCNEKVIKIVEDTYNY